MNPVQVFCPVSNAEYSEEIGLMVEPSFDPENIFLRKEMKLYNWCLEDYSF